MPPKAKRWLGALFAILTLSGSPWMPSSAAQGAPPAGESPETGVVHSWALAPGAIDGGAGDRPNLSYDLAPGTEATDAVTLYNYSNVPLAFDLYATDAFNNADGAFDLLPGDQKPSKVGTWITLPAARLTVPANTQANFPITIKVPIDARPGDHAGAILASSKALGTGADRKVVELDRRTGSRVYVRVAGRLEARLVVEHLETTYTPSLNPVGGTANVSYRVTNAGNIRLSGTARTTVGGPLGVFARSAADVELDEILPGESVEIRRTVENVAATGLAFTNVEVEPGEVQGRAGVELQPTARSGLSLAIPFTILAIALVALFLLRARKSYRRHQSVPSVEQMA